MKILIFAYDLVVAGVTVNAIELAAALRDRHGHDVTLFAAPGPMLGLVEQHRLKYIPAPSAFLHTHPSVHRVRALRDVVRAERPDIIHAWDWAQCIDAYYVEHLVMRVPMLVTDMSVFPQRLLPRHLPTTFNAPEIVDQAKRAGWRRAEVLLAPVDVGQNAPDALDPEPFRERYGLGPEAMNLVIVSRLDSDLKGEGLFCSVDAVRMLGQTLPLRLVLVGDGDARAALQQRADEANAELNRDAITLTGALIDPRPAYAAADVVIGMGGSALRGMAFGKPVIIVGEQGFAALFAPETADSFLYHGIYGVGRQECQDSSALMDCIQLVAGRREEFAALGAFGRNVVLEHFALEVVAAQLSRIFEAALADQPSREAAVLDGLTTAAVWVRERRFVPFGWSLKSSLVRGLRKAVG